MKSEIEQLTILLSKMDLPSHRKSRFTPQNLKWLEKNLCVKNSGHKDYQKAMDSIKSILYPAKPKKVA